MAYWIVKTEPSTYSWKDLVSKGEDTWDGVRNFQARNNLNQMKEGDLVLLYHSGSEKAVVGLAQVSQGAFPDPQDAAWVAVKLKAVRALENPLTLHQMQAEPSLAGISLLKQSRLSVHALSEEAFTLISRLSS
ncbi:MAG: EVE domain-containing protein [Bacteroidetes bacterium]|nr:EVE domain-containing protein [Bacteroidota bacterium]